MEVKKIVEGMTAVEVAEVIDSNFKNQNKIIEDVIAMQNSVIGVSEYKDFSEAEAVAPGEVRKYDGYLYECVEATSGVWDASKWKKSSFKAETDAKFAELDQEVFDISIKVSGLDIQKESYKYVNILSKQQIEENRAWGTGIKYAVNQDGILLQASKEAGVGNEPGTYYYVNFLLDDGIYWQKNHHYYCAVDIRAKKNSDPTIYLGTSPKFSNPISLGIESVKNIPNAGERGMFKTLIKANEENNIDLYPNGRILFIQFWNKIYPEDTFEAKIYDVILIDLGIPGTSGYKNWDDIDEIVMSGEIENSVATARIAKRLKVKGIECWGDSLTAQNYGKHIQGASVKTYGFGGKTSTYIRDKFLSDANKKATQVIWVGRNNCEEIDVVIDDIRDMVAAIEHNDFIVMCPPNGYYGTFGTNGNDGTGEMKGGDRYDIFIKLEKRLSEEYPSNFINIRKAVIEGWRMGNVKLLSEFTQPSIGGNVTIEVSDANFLTIYNSYDVEKFGEEFVTKIRIGINGKYDVYKIIEKVDDTHLTVQLEEINRISSGSAVVNLVDGGGTDSIKYLRVMQNADYMCWLYDTTLSTFRKDGIHMSEDGLKLVAQIVSRKLASMKLL